MSYARVRCVGLVGVTGHVLQVEADLAPGLHQPNQPWLSKHHSPCSARWSGPTTASGP